MKVRPVIVLAATAALACPAAGASAATGASLRPDVLGAFASNGGTIPPCLFSSATLDASLHNLPPDVAQYGTPLVDAIDQALAARAAGACDRARAGAPAGSGGPSSRRPIPTGSVTAATDAGVPTPLLLLAALGALLMLALVAAAASRTRGSSPHWAAGVRHSFAEAGYRAGGTWQDFLDWLRNGSPGPVRRRQPAIATPPSSAPAQTALARSGFDDRGLEPVPAGDAPATSEAIATSTPSPPAMRRLQSSRDEPALRRWPQRRAVAVAAAAATLAAVAVIVITLSATSTGVRPSKSQESIFQDDDHLLYASPATVSHTLAVLKRIGVDRVRVTVKWSAIAPDPRSRSRPVFDPKNPSAYPAGAWTPYDRVVRLAGAQGIRVDFDITAPGPLWATQRAPTSRAADHYAPSASELANFVAALGERYSGTYKDQSVPTAGPIPRVNYWSIWNEPNQPGWLAPQSRVADGRSVIVSAWLYRTYVNQAFLALRSTGHSTRTDTILIGELAPGGRHTPGWYTAVTPMQFLRALYCVDDSYRPLKGAAATVLGCQASGDPHSFVIGNRALFDGTGFAHHPYDLFERPSARPPDPDLVTLSTLSRLTGALDRIFTAYGVKRRMPLYLTEYGYQTNPPDPYQIVTPTQQAAYLNEAEYLAWRNPRVRSFAQFLLYDATPDTRYPPASFNYWDTFQTGLLYANGGRKPSFAAYRLPIWLPSSRLDRSGQVVVWGRVPSTPPGSSTAVRIQLRVAGQTYKTIMSIAARGQGYFTVPVHPPPGGELRLAWRSPNGKTLVSRSVAVSGA